MADNLMYISNDYTQNYPFNRLKLGVETFELNEYRSKTCRKTDKLKYSM